MPRWLLNISNPHTLSKRPCTITNKCTLLATAMQLSRRPTEPSSKVPMVKWLSLNSRRRCLQGLMAMRPSNLACIPSRVCGRHANVPQPWSSNKVVFPPPFSVWLVTWTQASRSVCNLVLPTTPLVPTAVWQAWITQLTGPVDVEVVRSKEEEEETVTLFATLRSERSRKASWGARIPGTDGWATFDHSDLKCASKFLRNLGS